VHLEQPAPRVRRQSNDAILSQRLETGVTVHLQDAAELSERFGKAGAGAIGRIVADTAGGALPPKGRSFRV